MVARISAGVTSGEIQDNGRGLIDGEWAVTRRLRTRNDIVNAGIGQEIGRSSVQNIALGSAYQGIASRIKIGRAQQIIAASSAIDQIIARGMGLVERVPDHSNVARERIIARLSQNRVASLITKDIVVAVAGEDRIVSLAAEDAVPCHHPNRPSHFPPPRK